MHLKGWLNKHSEDFYTKVGNVHFEYEEELKLNESRELLRALEEMEEKERQE